MSGEAWLFLFAVIINAVNLFLQVFFTIMYSDLEWYEPPAPPLYNIANRRRCPYRNGQHPLQVGSKPSKLSASLSFPVAACGAPQTPRPRP